MRAPTQPAGVLTRGSLKLASEPAGMRMERRERRRSIGFPEMILTGNSKLRAVRPGTADTVHRNRRGLNFAPASTKAIGDAGPPIAGASGALFNLDDGGIADAAITPKAVAGI